MGNENGAFPHIPPPPPPPPPPPQPPRRPSTLDSDMDDTMEFAPNNSPPDTPGEDGEFHFPVEDNYIDDEISSNANNLYIDRFPSAHRQNLIPGQDFVELPSTHKQNLIPNQDFVRQPTTPTQPRPTTSTNIFKKNQKTDNKKLIKKSKKPVFYKNIPQPKEVPFEILNNINQNDMPMPILPHTAKNNQNIETNLAKSLGDKIKQSNKCLVCDLQFKSKKAILKHNKEMHSEQKKIGKKRLIVLPISETGNEKKYGNWSKDVVIPDTEGNSDDIAVQECRLCNTEFNKHNALIRHLATIHDCNADYRPFTEPANKRKISQAGFVYSKTPKKKFGKFFYKCKLCSFTFASEDALNRHSENIHDILNIDGIDKYALPKGTKRKELAETEIFNCAICSTDFENKSYYISHLRLKHGVDQNYVKNEKIFKAPRKERANKSNKKAKEKYNSW